MNVTININIQLPVVQTVLRLPIPPTPASTEQSKVETEFHYMQHRQRMYDKIKRLFGNDAAIQYLAGTI